MSNLNPMAVDIASKKTTGALMALVRYRKATEALCGEGITKPGAHEEYETALLELIKLLPNKE